MACCAISWSLRFFSGLSSHGLKKNDYEPEVFFCLKDNFFSKLIQEWEEIEALKQSLP